VGHGRAGRNRARHHGQGAHGHVQERDPRGGDVAERRAEMDVARTSRGTSCPSNQATIGARPGSSGQAFVIVVARPFHWIATCAQSGEPFVGGTRIAPHQTHDP
jgi:hypothetical protein